MKEQFVVSEQTAMYAEALKCLNVFIKKTIDATELQLGNDNGQADEYIQENGFWEAIESVQDFVFKLMRQNTIDNLSRNKV